MILFCDKWLHLASSVDIGPLALKQCFTKYFDIAEQGVLMVPFLESIFVFVSYKALTGF